MNDKQLQLVNFEQAKRLKKAGFDWKIQLNWIDTPNILDKIYLAQSYRGEFVNFNDECHSANKYSAPSVALALKWMRDVKGTAYNIDCFFQFGNTYYRGYICKRNTDSYYIGDFDTYEAAENALLDELLTLLEKEV